MLEEGGGLFSLAGLGARNTLDATGWFFLPGISSVGPSAGRFIPPIPPTVHKHKYKAETEDKYEANDAHSDAVVILTRGASVEVVVVLRDVSQDAEAVRNFKSHHVFCIQ